MPAAGRDPANGGGVAPACFAGRSLGPIGTALAMAASAAAFVLAFPAFSMWWLAPVCVAAFAVAAVGARSTWWLAAVTALFWAGVWGWLQWWIIDVSTAGFPAFVTYLVAWSVAHAMVLRCIDGAVRWPLSLTLPITWIGLETFRGVILFNGYPWYFVGHPLIEVPVLVQSADLLGVPLIGWLVTMLGGAGADLWRWRGRLPRLERALAAAAVLLVAANVLYGVARLRQTDVLAGRAEVGPMVLAIQTNVPQSNKVGWAPAQQVKDFQSFVDLTQRAFREKIEAGRVPDMVAWPETMLPGFGLEQETIEVLASRDLFPGDAFAIGVGRLAHALQRPLLVGSPSFEGFREEDLRPRWDRHFNSVYVVDPDGARQRHDKVFLTPFGETMPYISALPWLEARLLDIGARGMRFDVDVGTSLEPLRVASPRGVWNAAMPICFEDTVSWLCRRMTFVAADEKATQPAEGGPEARDVAATSTRWGVRKRADLFINVSNDGWFGGNDAGRMQHAQIARFRCVECRLPMVRAVNTGLSVAIDSAGRLRGAAAGEGYGQARQAGWLGAEIVLDPRIPVYAALGDCLGWLALLATVLLVGWAAMRRRRDRACGREAKAAAPSAN